MMGSVNRFGLWGVGDVRREKDGGRTRLVSCLDHLLGVGEQRHKLVWVLYLDGCAASLSQLFCFQPLQEEMKEGSGV